MRTLLHAATLVALSAVLVTGEQSRGTNRPAARGGLVTDALNMSCAAVLGTGVKTQRDFCDVFIASAAKDSVSVAVPPHVGPATLLVDLHNRFTVPGPVSLPALAYARHQAVVAALGMGGDVLGQAVVTREFRTEANLFDQIAGGSRPGNVKAIAPGPPERAEFTIPANVTSVGIVGTRLKVTTRTGGEQLFDTPGRPIAIVSRVQVEYRPR